MPIIIEAHLTDGRVLRCDHECHDATDPHRPCICFSRFNGIGYDEALREAPEVFYYILKNAMATLPTLRSLELHLKPCTSLKKSVLSWGSTLRAIWARTRSTPPNPTARFGSSSRHH